MHPGSTAPGTDPSASGPGDERPEVSVLLIEPDRESAQIVQEDLQADGTHEVERVEDIAQALERVVDHGARLDVVLIGLPLRHESDLHALSRIRAVLPEALILPLGESATDTEEASTAPGTEARQAQRRAEVAWLPEALRFVAQRKAAEQTVQRAEEALYEEKERARVTLSSIGDAILVTDATGCVTYLNPVAENLTGWRHAEAKGHRLSEVFDLIDGTSREPALNPLWQAIAESQVINLEANRVLRHRDGGEHGIEDSAAPIQDRHGGISGGVIVFREISQSRTVTQRMAYLARHDALTGLANRTLLDERLSQAMRLGRRHGRRLGLLFVDLDGFKRVNDEHGHRVGDRLLQRVAALLQASVRESDTVCRLGGDEFLVLLAEIEQVTDAEHIAEKIRASLASAVQVGGYTLRATASIGVATWPEHGDAEETLIQSADRAVYRAKAGHGDRCALPA